MLAVCLVSCATASQMAPLVDTTFGSEDGSHVVEIAPSLGKPGYCAAKLSRIATNGTTVVWKRHLVNNYAPLSILVANSGTSVVTLDEWVPRTQHAPAQFPLAIYGYGGTLIRLYNYEQLPAWSRDAIVFFGPKDQSLFVRIQRGSLLIFDLKFGDLMDDEWFELHKGWSMSEKEWLELREFGRAELKQRALRALDSANGDTRRTAAIVCGQEGYEESIPALERLLLDDAHSLRGTPGPWNKFFYVRKSARDALLQLGKTVNNVVVEEPYERWNNTEHRTSALTATNQSAPLRVPD